MKRWRSTRAPCRSSSAAIQSTILAWPGVPGLRGPKSTWVTTRRCAREPSTSKRGSAHARPARPRVSAATPRERARGTSEGELRAQLDAHGAVHRPIREIAILAEAQLEVARDVGAERVTALRVDREPV